jgi:hypothetical protein
MSITRQSGDPAGSGSSLEKHDVELPVALEVEAEPEAHIHIKTILVVFV